MPTLPKGHPDRPLYSASRLMIILGALCLLGAIAIGYVGLWGLALVGPTGEVLAWLGAALFTFGGGVALLFMAEGMRRHRRRALYAGIVVTMLFMLLLELGFPLLYMADWGLNVRGISLLALLLFGLLLYQLFRSRRAIRLHEMGGSGHRFEVVPHLDHPHADAVQALPAVAEDEVRERRWPVVACTVLLLVVPCVVLYKTVAHARQQAGLANVERELAAAVEQYLAALDPESEITQRFGRFTGMRDVTYSPGFQISPDAPARSDPILGATAQFPGAEAPVVLVVRNGPAVKIEGIRLMPNLEHWQAKGWRVEQRGVEFWLVSPGGWKEYNPHQVDESSPMRLTLVAEATHPNVR